MTVPLKVGVLRGGLGHEYDVSLRTGANIITNLPSEKFQPVDILITKDGKWHLSGLPVSPEQAVRRVDVIFNALHGQYGEDGQVQQFLDYLGGKYTGSRALASALGMNKPKAKEIFRQAGLKVPQDIVLRQNANFDFEAGAYEAFRRLSPPWIIKPADSGSSVGLYLARTYPELVLAIRSAFNFSDEVMVEEYIKGREATCGVIERMRSNDYYALLPIEIIPSTPGRLFDYEAKYGGETKEICPGSFSLAEKREIERLAKEVHKLLDLKHYSRADFIVSPKGIYVLEVNTLPGLTNESLIPKSLKATGISYPQFLEHVINLALEDY